MIHWVIGYFVIGAALGFISNVHMVDSGKSRAYKIRATLGLLFFWPAMIAYVLLIALFFMFSGGLF